MMKVNTQDCIGCGKCVKDCFPRDIEMIEGKASIKNITCMKCGHCIAVCPKNAISTDEYDMEEVKAYDKETFDIDAEHLLNFIKFRRSTRHFKSQKIEEEKLCKIIEAGRFTQTGTNIQDVSYIVVTDALREVKALTFESLKNKAEEILANLTPETMRYERYAKMWLMMYKAYKQNPEVNDKLFFNAPAIIVVTSPSDVNGALASSNMELMTNALGLGTFFSGFFALAAGDNQEIREMLGIEEGKKIVTCMVVGYPDVKYLRTVPRRKANITWK